MTFSPAACPLGSKYLYHPTFVAGDYAYIGPSSILYPDRIEYIRDWGSMDGLVAETNRCNKGYTRYRSVVDINPGPGENSKHLCRFLNDDQPHSTSAYIEMGIRKWATGTQASVGVFRTSGTVVVVEELVTLSTSTPMIITTDMECGPSVSYPGKFLFTGSCIIINANTLALIKNIDYQEDNIEILNDINTTYGGVAYSINHDFVSGIGTPTIKLTSDYLVAPNPAFTGTCLGEIYAEFSAVPTSGNYPVEVTFTDESGSVSGITTWHWNFGDGISSSLQNPTHTYTRPGAFDVSLTVIGPDGTDTQTKTEFIDSVGAYFTGTPVIGAKPLEVKFTPQVHIVY